MYLRIAFVSIMPFWLVVAGCSPRADQPSPEQLAHPKAGETLATTSHPAEKLVATHLPNAVRIHEKVISGGLPKGDDAFVELRDFGVKTVISVDGAKPDVEMAAKHGLRYVHLPHGYDGIPDERVKELAKAVRDLDGPIYIHCHHGKHRSPAAASVACVSAGLISPADALPVLKLAGTSDNYRGLFQAVERARPLEEALLNELRFEFRETVDVPPLAEAMVAIEHVHDHLKAIAKARWKTPVKQPDLEPAHEALLLREHFTELLRVDYVRQQPDEFQAWLRHSESAARQLESALRQWGLATTQQNPPKTLQTTLDRITHDCKVCHQKYRDQPLSEKIRTH